MDRMRLLLFICLGSIGLASVAPGVAAAAWPAMPYSNLPLHTGPGDQYGVAVAPDGAGGMVVAWVDDLSGTSDIYAQRVTADGQVLWTAGGTPVSTVPSSQWDPRVIASGNGGAVVIWQDNRNGNTDLYAQSVSANGVSQWAAGGVPVVAGSGEPYRFAATSDGAGGAIVAWYEFIGGTAVIMAQRIDAAGALAWGASGLVVASGATNGRDPGLVPDGAGGAIIGWLDWRTGNSTDIYAQRVTAAGTTAWAVDGVAVCTAPGSVYAPVMVPDDAGGAVFAWSDNRVSSYSDVYTQRLSGDGIAQWTTDGVLLCAADGGQWETVIAPDGDGGAIVAWRDARMHGRYDIYAQHVSGTGTATWASDGVRLCNDEGTPHGLAITPDDVGGAFFMWSDSRDVPSHLYGQRIAASGDLAWPANGLPISLAAGGQSAPRVVAGGGGRALAAWVDSRDGNFDIYAQGIEGSGYDPSAPAITSVRDIAGDQGGKVRVAWTRSFLDTAPGYQVSLYGIWRQVTAAAAKGAVAGGAPLAGPDASATLPQPGVFRATADGAKLRYWEGVGTVAARGQQSYTFVATTLQDSTGAGPAWSVFMVDAHLAFQPGFSDSAPDSGYSVDNLAPPMPAPFSGHYQGGATTLHWGSSYAVDMAGYRLHRGDAPEFTPGPANLVATTVDVDYVDHVAGFHHYRLFAVDSHGNLSPAATLSPQQTTPVPDAPSAALRLAPNVPNPFNPQTTLRFSLPAAGRARLSVFDVAGRLVRTLVDADLAAGGHEVVWDGRDEGGRDVGSGSYLARLESGGRLEAIRMALVR